VARKRDRTFDRRALLAGAAGTLAAAGSTGSLLWPEESRAASGSDDVAGVVLETVTGPVKGKDPANDFMAKHQLLLDNTEGAL
jgi:hypothetical protein